MKGKINDVLQVDRMGVCDGRVAYIITHQDEEIFKRGYFDDEELHVQSEAYPQYGLMKIYLRGRAHERDYTPIMVPVEKEESFLSLICEVNRKYIHTKELCDIISKIKENIDSWNI